MRLSRSKKTVFIVILAVVLIAVDQFVKILVKTNMHLGESIHVFGDWFQILFIENEGMAFGMAFGGDIGKYILTTFRLVLSVLLFFYIRHLLLKKDAPLGVLLGLTAIMIGAVGNLVDCMFYGLIFEPSSYTHVASMVPFGDGYGKFGLGKVVDMLYFPLIDTTWPDWVPGKGGESLVFFRPVFNIADSCITVGALYLLIFKWKYFQIHDSSK
ncbi:MAG TPA: lipoprotein signal peptidase [Candidatus Coprenecus stercoravium]|uniref:Lipoprotein signal peptidase n=1 Tax=Candidatus Coprenecus stercoravium TaxID=2840735 RepID=A0A9D2GSP7_9BACT|nr:lipoprotein signal peptidase [Candidatus Coprenecus stercoravium]